jgi:hypothetical protein
LGRKYDHIEKKPTPELLEKYMNRVKQYTDFSRRIGVLNNAESNRGMTPEMLKILHEEVYKVSPAYKRATEEHKKGIFKRRIY